MPFVTSQKADLYTVNAVLSTFLGSSLSNIVKANFAPCRNFKESILNQCTQLPTLTGSLQAWLYLTISSVYFKAQVHISIRHLHFPARPWGFFGVPKPDVIVSSPRGVSVVPQLALHQCCTHQTTKGRSSGGTLVSCMKPLSGRSF